MPTYSSLENIFKCIISQNPENLDLAEGVCNGLYARIVSGYCKTTLDNDAATG